MSSDNTKHALLSPSSSHIWLNCPPSVRLAQAIPDETTDYALQGTDAHRLCEYKLKKALGFDAEDPRNSLRFLDQEMEDCSDEYAQFVLEAFEQLKLNCPDPAVFIEQRVDFSAWVPEGFGFSDCILVADHTVHVIDYKHGEGVLVESENNSQMMCYALGAIALLDKLYDIDTVSMTIFQPRRGNVSTWTISKPELFSWAEAILTPTALLAYKGEGKFRAGDHCRFCRARCICRARADYNMELTKREMALPETLEDDDITDILTRVDPFIKWATEIKEYALSQALNGKKYSGFKVVEGKSNRQYTDEDAVAKAVIKSGYDPYEQSVLGITNMTKLLGKKKFEEVLGPLVYKPAGKPALVPESDKRPEIKIENQTTNVMEVTYDN